MAGIEAWNAVAEATVACEDPAIGTAMTKALTQFGLQDDERRSLLAATDRREDPAGLLLRDLAEHARPVRAQHSVSWPRFEPAQMDRAITVATEVMANPLVVREPSFADQLRVLEALPPERVGAFVLDLVSRSGGAGGRSIESADRDAAWHAAALVSDVAPMTRVQVGDLMSVAATADDEQLTQLAEILVHAPRTRLLRGLASVLRAGPSLRVPELIGRVASMIRDEGVAGAPLPSTAPATGVGSEPSDQVSTGWPDLTGRPGIGGAAPTEPVYRSGGQSPADAQGPPSQLPSRSAHARIDLTTGTERPDVVVVEQEFTLTLGLGPRPSFGIVSTGQIRTDGGDIDLVLIYDPTSLTPHGPTRHTITPTQDQPYPSVEVTCTANYLAEGPATRRIGLQYLVDGQVVGLAWRTFVAVDEPALVGSAPAPPSRERELLDLTPLITDDPPDLVLAVHAADTGSERWVWTAFAADPALAVPDAPNVATLDGEVAQFALATRRAIQFSTDRQSDYLTLAGRAHRIGASMPAAAREALRALLNEPGRTSAPSVLLLTEELVIPWELAAIGRDTQTAWGGTSPFLGAHVALGRWPLTEHRPRPVPRDRVTVSSAAVITADYTGVAGWGRLEHAMAEADEVAALFTPPATRIEPDLVAVIDLLRGQPPADVLHVALHGQFDHEGDQEGIVLVQRREDTVKAQFLTPIQVENGDLANGPFVFLNACQVGADERVLGSYGGFASTLLRIGAAGVVAPLWNIDDHVAATIARDFYAHTLGPEQVSVAEAMRRIRTAYTEDAVRAGTPGATSPTLLAFQVFGHPHLRLTRSS